MATRSGPRPPWERKNPKKKAAKPMSGSARAAAKARARAAGRPYPNLVDNMAVARKTRKATKRSTPKRATKTTRRSGTVRTNKSTTKAKKR